LIGNGPAALAKEVGEEIDNFSGQVWRFNHYVTNGFEKWVGSRCDVWVTVADFPQHRTSHHKKRYYVSHRYDEPTQKSIEKIGATRLPRDVFVKASKEMGFFWPSTGVITTQWLLDHGHEVWLWGFNFLEERHGHHYSKDGQKRGKDHSSDFEWLYFHRLMEQGRVRYFGQDPTKESSPIVRAPVPCGKDDDISWYRESAHEAWYLLIALQNKGKTFLDVGAGLCGGMKVLEGQNAKEVHGFDVDPRLIGLHDNLFVGDSLDIFSDKSYDVVTCIDVIEHIIEDKVLMEHLKRIAREKIYVTTPNYTRSRCGNIAHCREYTMAQFMNVFQPNEIWSGSPDGSVHQTLVMERSGKFIIDRSPEGVENKQKVDTLFAYEGKVPIHTSFSQTVDFEEWAHICGVWKVNG
jgi:2-polyprenyl-3-methyl-5-hydroxy-6-metoxy-1,4-benzoquinol methylase